MIIKQNENCNIVIPEDVDYRKLYLIEKEKNNNAINELEREDLDINKVYDILKGGKK